MTAALWTSADAAAATGGRATATWAASGVWIDSRRVAAGDLFVALRGPTFDGHDFVPVALKAGAAAAVVGQTPGGVADTAALLMVDDTQAALEALARAARDRACELKPDFTVAWYLDHRRFHRSFHEPFIVGAAKAGLPLGDIAGLGTDGS